MDVLKEIINLIISCFRTPDALKIGVMTQEKISLRLEKSGRYNKNYVQEYINSVSSKASNPNPVKDTKDVKAKPAEPSDIDFDNIDSWLD